MRAFDLIFLEVTKRKQSQLQLLKEILSFGITRCFNILFLYRVSEAFVTLKGFEHKVHVSLSEKELLLQ